MAVTEIALLHAKADSLGAAFTETALAARSVQEQWHAKNYPNLPSSPVERADTIFQQIEDPTAILLTARWDSVEAHWQWIGSDDNKAVMSTIGEHIDAEGEDAFVLFHLDNEIFSEPAPQGQISLLDSPVVSVNRMPINSDKKARFNDMFSEVKGIVEAFAGPHLVRGGWVVDKQDQNKDEFVLVCGWDSVARHLAFADRPDFPQYKRALDDFVSAMDIKHYKKFL